ncbi:MAG: type II toxin-antitoxin system Phd/YefM family antitoxin [Burkholderiales bacterium]|nr:type II toxin-antitoxin system Phd/YefM family antitoxin [Burkholderiales bacterium]
MKYLTISDARAHLPGLLDQLDEQGLVITRRGKPIAKLVRYRDKTPAENDYPLRSLPLQMDEDFNAPLIAPWEALE